MYNDIIRILVLFLFLSHNIKRLALTKDEKKNYSTFKFTYFVA